MAPSLSDHVRAAAQRGLRAAMEAFGEELVFTPMAPAADVNAAPGPDPARAVGTFRGIFFDPRAKPQFPHAFDPRTDLRPGAMSGQPYFRIFGVEREIFIGIKAGDVLQRPDGPEKSPGSRWRVSATFMGVAGDLYVTVNAI